MDSTMTESLSTPHRDSLPQIELTAIQSDSDVESDASPSRRAHIFVNPRPPRGCSKVASHTSLLLLKNWRIFTRSLKPTLFVLLAPVGVILLLIFFQMIADDYTEYTQPHPPIQEVPVLPRCTKPSDCITLGYSIIVSWMLNQGNQTEWPHAVMKEVSERNELQYGSDVQLIYRGERPSAVDSYLLNHEGKVDWVVHFCTTVWLVQVRGFEQNYTLPCTYQEEEKQLYFYMIETNFTKRPNSFFISLNLPTQKDIMLLRLKSDIDNAILNYHSQLKGAPRLPLQKSIEITWSDYPKTQDRFLGGMNILTTHGNMYLFFAPLGVFIVIFMGMANEKHKGLRKGLGVMGVSHSGYLLSWSLTGIVFSITTALILSLLGLASGFSTFVRVPFILIFLLFFLLTVALVQLALLLSICLQSQESANTAVFAIALFSIAFQRIFSSGNTMQFVFFHTEASWALKLALYILYFYAPFNYAKLYHDFTHISQAYFDDEATRWVAGRDYNWSDLLEHREGEYRSGGGFSTPYPLYSYFLMLFNICFYSFLVWYADNVIEGNRGSGR